MKKTVTEKQRAERDRRIAMPCAKVIRPLKYVRAMTNYTARNAKGYPEIVQSPQSESATRFAARGLGRIVQHMALRLAL